jgi:predicted RNase H-like HicB family nuclease
VANWYYTVLFEPEDDGGYHAFCPTLRGCHSQGDTLEEATANIREAIALYLESLQADGLEPPVEDLLIKPIAIAA